MGTPSSAGTNSGAGGSVGNAGWPSASGYCGAAPPSAHLEQFAAPDVVWRRIQLFVLDGLKGPVPELPELTTRGWAAEQAMIALNSASNEVPAGLLRFVNGWLPGSKRAAQWAGILASSSSLRYLMTTDLGQDHGVGVLTDPVILEQRNLVERGVYIANHLLCLPIPPPLVVIPQVGNDPRGGTRRTQFAAHTSNPACAGCHARTDPFGVALEHFTPVTGEYSTLDNGYPIDSSTTIQLEQTGLIPILDAADLGEALGTSCEVARCLTQQLLADAESSAQLPVPGSTDPAAVAEIAFASYQSGHSLRGLIWYLVQSDTFLRP
jgi:hypothetical protein